MSYSSQPRKQRKAIYTAPQHVARKQIASHLAEQLLLDYNRRSLTLVVGDEVQVMRGDFAGTKGKVVTIDVPERKVTVEGVVNKKADGTKVPRPIAPSNLLITRLNLDDKMRRAKLDAGKESKQAGGAAKPKKAAAKAEAGKKPKAEKGKEA
jgi:large subunit ribosomal protein L24